MSRETFEQVVERHGPAVLRVCRAVVGPDAAEDAWSETFLSAMQAYPDLPDEANVETWLVTIAHRKALDQARARKRRATPTDQIPERVASDDRQRDLELLAAVSELPAKQRQVVAYHYLAGIPYQEIAEILGGTAAAARRAGADGINALRRNYTPSAENARP